MSWLRAVCVGLLGVSLAGLGGCGGSVTGTWELDKDKTITQAEKSLEKEMKDAGPARDLASTMLKKSIESSTITLTLRADNTFKADGTFGPTPLSIEGKWKKVKDVYELTPDDLGSVMNLRQQGGGLILEASGGSSRGPAMYLKRK